MKAAMEESTSSGIRQQQQQTSIIPLATPQKGMLSKNQRKRIEKGKV